MFDKILVPIDLERVAQSTGLLKAAEGFADEFGSSVHVLTVMPGYGMAIVAEHFPPDAKARAKAKLEQELAKFVESRCACRATTSVVEGRRAEEILKAAKRRKSDLILIGCQSHGKVQDALLGSVGTRVAQHAECSVMVVR